MNLLLVILVSQLGTQATHHLILKKNLSGVRASSLVTILFISATIPLSFEHINFLHAACLGASFVGMSDPKRLNTLQLALASLVFALFFYFFIHQFKGLGGALGFSAFISCVAVYFLSSKLASIRSGLQR